MAGFLRKKSKNDTPGPNSPSNPHHTAPSAPTPLFARFATTNGPAKDHKVVVSGPMALSAVRRDSASIHSTRNAPPHVDQQRRRTANNAAPPSAFSGYDPRSVEISSNHGQEEKTARYSLGAQQPLAPVIRDKPLPAGDPYTAYRRSVRAPQPVYAQPGPPAVDHPHNGPPLQPRSSGAGTIMSQPARTSSPLDSQGRQSPFIDLPPEIALFQEFGDSLFTTTPPDSLNSKPTGQPQQPHQHASARPPIPPSSSPPPISSPSHYSLPPLPPKYPPLPPPPENDMGVNISTGHGDLLSSPLKDFRLSLRSSTLNSFSNNTTPTQQHNEKRSPSFSPYPQQPNSPPRRAPASPPAPTAHIPMSSSMPASPPKTPSKRQTQQKALPQLPPKSTTPPMSRTPPTRHHTMGPPGHAQLRPSPAALPRTMHTPPLPQGLGPYTTGVIGTNPMMNPNKPRIFAAMEGGNGNPNQTPMYTNRNGETPAAFRMSHLPEIPQEFDMRSGYPPSPPTEYIRTPQSYTQQLPPMPGPPRRASLPHQQQQPRQLIASDVPQHINASPSVLSKSRPVSVVSGSSRINRTSNVPTSPPPSSFSPPPPPLPATALHRTTSSGPPTRSASSSTQVSSSPSIATTPSPPAASLLDTPPPPPRTRELPVSNTPTATKAQTQTAGESEASLTHIPPHQDDDHANMNMNGTASGLTVPDNADALSSSPQLAVNGNVDKNGRPLTPASPQPRMDKLEPLFELTFDSGIGMGKGGIGEPLFDEGDPFAKVDGVKVVAGSGGAKSDIVESSAAAAAMEGRDKDKDKGERKGSAKDKEEREKEKREKREKRKEKERKKSKSKERSKDGSKSKERKGSTSAPQVQLSSSEEPAATREGQDTMATGGIMEDKNDVIPTPRFTEHRNSRALVFSQLMSPPPPLIADMIARVAEKEKHRATDKKGPYILLDFVSDPEFLQMLLEYLTFYDWCLLASVSREIRIVMVQKREVREDILERYLRPVGYQRWGWEDPDPLSLSLQDLSDYMRGVSTPTHEYARIANLYVQSLSIHPNHRDMEVLDTVRALTASTRAYTRVVLRLRVQAEKELAVYNANMRKNNINFNERTSPHRSPPTTRASSRAPSPTYSSFSHSHSQHHLPQPPSRQNSPQLPPLPRQQGVGFRSPLFRMRRAPLLRVFVPSPEGDWLSDKSVLECEAECRRAGVTKLLRMGDVIWDIAVGDEGNVGRLIWDGSYLIDLDYTYSPTGELPKYMHALAFPPSYFHRVIRPGSMGSNPIVHIDLTPWGEEIATNLQLLQDRVRTETPQGAYHNVVRWVHRSSFVIRPPSRNPSMRAPFGNNNKVPVIGRIPIPGMDNLFVDPGWYGTIVVETEGTNEALADLQDRCGPGAFPPRVRGAHVHVTQAQAENRKVFRILREKSRPGEIWIKCVGGKERLL